MACGYKWIRKPSRPMSCTGEGRVEGRHRRHHLAYREPKMNGHEISSICACAAHISIFNLPPPHTLSHRAWSCLYPLTGTTTYAQSRGVGTGVIWHRKVPPSGLALRERQHQAMAGSELLHYPRNVTAHYAARTNFHIRLDAQTRRLRSGYVDWRSDDGEQSRASGYGVALGRRSCAYSLISLCACLLLPKILVPPFVVIGPRNEFPVISKDVSVSVSSPFFGHFSYDDSPWNLRQAPRGHLLKTVSTVVAQRLSFVIYWCQAYKSKEWLFTSCLDSYFERLDP